MYGEVMEAIEELKDDLSVPRNVKEKLAEICVCISKADSLQINKVMDNLDDISNDINLQSYVRTQIWNITTMLENVKPSVEILK